MKKLGIISQGDWEHLRKITPDTPPNCPYIVLTISSGKKFGLSKIQKGIKCEINLMLLNPPTSRSIEIVKAEPAEWIEAEEISTQLLSTCKAYEPAP